MDKQTERKRERKRERERLNARRGGRRRRRKVGGQKINYSLIMARLFVQFPRRILFVTTVTFLAITPAVAPAQIIYCTPASVPVEPLLLLIYFVLFSFSLYCFFFATALSCLYNVTPPQAALYFQFSLYTVPPSSLSGKSVAILG